MSASPSRNVSLVHSNSRSSSKPCAGLTVRPMNIDAKLVVRFQPFDQNIKVGFGVIHQQHTAGGKLLHAEGKSSNELSSGVLCVF